MSITKLNPKRTTPKTVQAVAAKHNLNTGLSANGNLQFVKPTLQHLYELAVGTLFGKSTYYHSSDTLVQHLRVEVRKAVQEDALDFVANLAIHARTEMNIRTIPIVLVVEFAQALREQGKSYSDLRRVVCDVIQRADQVTDIYAYALDVFGDKKKIPMAIKRGVSDALNKFSEYQFAKYNRDGAIKFRDVLRIVHPTAKTLKQGEIFKKIMEDTLETPYAWEVELSKNGQLPVSEQKSKKDLWTELFLSGKMGYMAQLRNLRNLVQSDADSSTITKVADFISDPVRVVKSKQLTFDYMEAYNIVQPLNSKLATAVSKAMDASIVNIPKLGEKIWIIIDYSGSMGNDNGPAISTSTLLAAALLKANESADNLAVTLFGSAAMTLNSIDTNNSVLAIQKTLLSHRKGNIGGSTDFHAALKERKLLGFNPDTIIVFTDGEVNRFPYSALRQYTGNNSIMKMVVNMHGTTTTPFIKEDNWYTCSGWTPAMFHWVKAIRDKETVVDSLSVPYMGIRKVTQEADS